LEISWEREGEMRRGREKVGEELGMSFWCFLLYPWLLPELLLVFSVIELFTERGREEIEIK